jgi:hypothetical protein
MENLAYNCEYREYHRRTEWKTQYMRKLMLLTAVASLLALTVFAPVAQAVSPIPVEGKVLNKNGKVVGTFTGTVSNIDVSYVKNRSYDGLKVSGVLHGDLDMNSGQQIDDVTKQFLTKAKASVPGAGGSGEVTTQAVCKILDLDIGRIHLDLLGLVVDLAPIHLDITAVEGPGNLLGNLLCALVGILDPNSALADFLNNLLAQLDLLGELPELP